MFGTFSRHQTSKSKNTVDTGWLKKQPQDSPGSFFNCKNDVFSGLSLVKNVLSTSNLTQKYNMGPVWWTL